MMPFVLIRLNPVSHGKSIHRWPLQLKCFWKIGQQRQNKQKDSANWFSIHLTSPLLIQTITWQEKGTEKQRIGRGGGSHFASHLLTVKHVVIIVHCPLVYLPQEDSGPLLVTIGPDNQLSMCPLSNVIYITRLSLLCRPLCSCYQSFPAQTQKQAFNKNTVNALNCLQRGLEILIGSYLCRNKATLTLRGSTSWRHWYSKRCLLFLNETKKNTLLEALSYTVYLFIFISK